ncbi:hypothetical protein [Sporisorium scitamineum]|uniref:Uncharacterized protein n=1 Tax=Sporisorium scitamineum TaxID=49012 RepID=A0A0F7RSK8_9BASI|nr:hypothetical protein [Sporisorium scitamineum]
MANLFNSARTAFRAAVNGSAASVGIQLHPCHAALSFVRSRHPSMHTRFLSNTSSTRVTTHLFSTFNRLNGKDPYIAMIIAASTTSHQLPAHIFDTHTLRLCPGANPSTTIYALVLAPGDGCYHHPIASTRIASKNLLESVRIHQ